MTMRIDLEVLSSFDFVITTSTSDSEHLLMSIASHERESQRISMRNLEVLSFITATSTSDSE